MTEQEVLALVRTLLAHERNYLAIERTQLAELRTGLTIALVSPPAAATLAYVFSFLSENILLSSIAYIFLTIITILGVWMTFRAYIGLRETRRIKTRIRSRELEVIRKSEFLNTILRDIIETEY